MTAERSRLALGAITFRDRPIEDIVAAAAGAGFDGIGLTVGQCVSALERGVDLEQLARLLDEAGLILAELELVRLCERGAVAHLNAAIVELAGLLRPNRVHVAAWRGERSQIVEEFAALCHALPDIPVAFEFMAYNAVPGFESAIELAEATGAPNASVLLDVLHFFRTGGDPSALTAAAMRRVAAVHLSDVVSRPRDSALDEARHRRTFPGRGSLDIPGFLAAIAAAGPFPPITVEPINDAYERLPLAFVADEAMVATSRLLRQGQSGAA